ncbi:MAG: ketol-acid reductoisomerase [Candidatus Electrothrix sp. AR4]|nr:ketol-acid reductoisomerase [Candidatus Electrothrix sp. AR4]
MGGTIEPETKTAQGDTMHRMRLFLIAVVVAVAGCAPIDQYPQRALIEPKQVVSAIEIEKQLTDRRDVALPDGEQWFEVIERAAPIILSAPHSTRPLRNGKRRFSDGGGTAALALALGEITGSTVIYTTYEGPSDPNYYDDNAYKKELARLVDEKKPLLVLDFHGSHPYRSYDIDIGTMDGVSLLGNEEFLFNFIRHLNDEGIFSVSYNRFGAEKHGTITKFVSKKGVPVMQLEINATYVTPSAGNIEAQRFSRLLQGLTRYIEEFLTKQGLEDSTKR